uniref:Uncharacterized protein n=1 Tax=Tanacetum cinerariifolium TaxID=118510 RepID=A0A699K7Q2_TANCI|nr:hypothetical protein [Tanacetum cinerariifolium]
MLFNNTKKWIEAFVHMDTELVKDSEKSAEGSEKVVEGSERIKEGSSKRAASNLEQGDAKRQRLEEENESAELKRYLEIIPEDDDDVTTEATPLSSKSPTIVEYKIYKKGGKAFSKSLEQMSSHDNGSKPASDDGKKVDEDPRKESECKDQEKEDNVNSTSNVNTVSLTVNAAGTNEVNAISGKISIELLFD